MKIAPTFRALRVLPAIALLWACGSVDDSPIYPDENNPLAQADELTSTPDPGCSELSQADAGPVPECCSSPGSCGD